MTNIPIINNAPAPQTNTQGKSTFVPVPAKTSEPQAILPEKAVQAVERPKAELPNNLSEGQKIDIFVVRDNVFSLYKLPNGEFFSKIRDLRTGQEQVFPLLDTLSYYEALRGNRGIFIEKNV